MNFSPLGHEGYANSPFQGGPMAPPSQMGSYSSQGQAPLGPGFQPGGLSAAVRAMQMPGGMPFAQQALRINAGLPAQNFGGGMPLSGSWNPTTMGRQGPWQQPLYAGGPGQAFMGGGSPQTMPMPQYSPQQQLAQQAGTMSRYFYSPFNSPYGGMRDASSNYGHMPQPPPPQQAAAPQQQLSQQGMQDAMTHGVAGPGQAPPWGAAPQPLWNQPMSGMSPSGWTPGYGIDPARRAAMSQGAMFPQNY